MSLTSYRAAPPRVNLCTAFRELSGVPGSRFFAPPIHPNGFLRRLEPGGRARPSGASGMYQCEAGLERAFRKFFCLIVTPAAASHSSRKLSVHHSLIRGARISRVAPHTPFPDGAAKILTRPRTCLGAATRALADYLAGRARNHPHEWRARALANGSATRQLRTNQNDGPQTAAGHARRRPWTTP